MQQIRQFLARERVAVPADSRNSGWADTRMKVLARRQRDPDESARQAGARRNSMPVNRPCSKLSRAPSQWQTARPTIRGRHRADMPLAAHGRVSTPSVKEPVNVGPATALFQARWQFCPAVICSGLGAALPADKVVELPAASDPTPNTTATHAPSARPGTSSVLPQMTPPHGHQTMIRSLRRSGGSSGFLARPGRRSPLGLHPRRCGT
jgi:hypothetical protein